MGCCASVVLARGRDRRISQKPMGKECFSFFPNAPGLVDLCLSVYLSRVCEGDPSEISPRVEESESQLAISFDPMKLPVLSLGYI